MNTNDMPEDELDDLFRKSASEYHPPYDPEAWQAMEEKLNAHATKKAIWQRFVWAAALLLLVGVGTWIGFTKLKQSNNRLAGNVPVTQQSTLDLNNKQTQQPPETAGTINYPSVNAASTPGKADKNNPGITPRLPNKRAGEIISVGVPAGSRPQNRTKNQQNRKIYRSAVPIASGDNNELKTDKTRLAKSIEPASAEAAMLSSKTLETTQHLNGSDIPDSVNQLMTKSLPAMPTDTTRTTAVVTPPDSAANTPKQKLLDWSRFTFNVMVAPDLSSVGFSNLGGISTNAGVTVTYNFTDKWSLTTGIIKARKIYDAKPGDYGDKYYWYNRHLPDDITAVCRVLDIPVNVGYNLWQGQKSVLTVQTGLSSYRMLNEKYTYEYYAPNPYTTVWQVDNNNQSLFSIYNLSVRYGRQLAPSLLVGVEPFVKVPLAGVGAGKIKLASAGVFFSLSYRYSGIGN